ncbi:MAG: NAD-dependent deacylase [Nitrospinae bacterium]|nr:NAD-dependent deacylase [Nitrospinota bacterium]
MDDLARVRERLAIAKSVAVLTGAGVSAESGVPTFRGPQGLWRNFRPEELATPDAFERDPKLVWEWYDWRRGLIAPLKPNPGHYAIAEMEKRFPEFLLITQNVDGLHRVAGNAKMVELHGNIWHARCTAEGTVRENRDVPLKEIPPRCRCGALLRPHIVWFGESLEEDVLEKAVNSCKRCEVLIVAGTSSVVQPAASLAGIAREAGAFVVEVNPEETPLTPMADAYLQGASGLILPQLMMKENHG